jgi:hypothetical protein
VRITKQLLCSVQFYNGKFIDYNQNVFTAEKFRNNLVVNLKPDKLHKKSLVKQKAALKFCNPAFQHSSVTVI